MATRRDPGPHAAGRPAGGRDLPPADQRLQTNDPTLDVQQAVAAYKQLQTVERGFRCLKDVLAIRPIYHRTEPRVRAHLFAAHSVPAAAGPAPPVARPGGRKSFRHRLFETARAPAFRAVGAFPRYQAVYGSLAGVIVFLLWVAA